MDSEEVWQHLRKKIRYLPRKEQGILWNFGKKLKDGDDVPDWLDARARAALVDMRTPLVHSHSCEDDRPDYEEQVARLTPAFGVKRAGEIMERMVRSGMVDAVADCHTKESERDLNYAEF